MMRIAERSAAPKITREKEIMDEKYIQNNARQYNGAKREVQRLCKLIVSDE